MNSIFRGILFLAAAALLVIAAVVATDWRLFLRFATMPADVADPASATWHEPRATVGTGSGTEIPLARDDGPRLPDAALAASWKYAQETGTDALIVAYEGEIQFERYGAGVDQDTLFQSQSLHKGLTAIALGAAIHEGSISSMDQPAADYLAEWQGDPRKSRISLADLAYMQGGLERGRYAAHPFSPGIQLFLSGKLEKRVFDTPAVADTQSTYIWSNASTQALAIAIERAVGRPWADFLREALWEPMGAGEAYVQLDGPGGTAQAFCCFISSPRNWLRLGQLLLDDGIVNGERLLPAGWVKTMTTPGVTNPNYGMQLWVNEPNNGEFLLNGQPRFTKQRGESLAATDAYYIEGHFAQRLHVVPSAGLVVVRFGDDVDDWDDARLMNDLIAAAQDIRRPTGLPPVPPPDKSFADSRPPEVPDYSDIGAWAAHPDKFDVSDFDPPGFARPDEPIADGFYIYPTTYRGMTWNARTADPAANRDVDAVVMAQGSVLGDCCNIYAPRYRQAVSASVYDRTNGPQAYALAFEDVRAAFREFVSLSDRPFVVIGHSQGAFHTQRLLTEEIAGTPLAERMVAAYVVGISSPRGLFETDWRGLVPCDDPTVSGCVASWVTFGTGADVSAWQQLMAQRFSQHTGDDGTVNLLCTNPLTGNSGTADRSGNAGSVALPDVGGYMRAAVPGLVGATCDRGMLKVDGDPGEYYKALALPGDNYHFYDIALFYANLRSDVLKRAMNWHAEHAGQ